MSGIKVRNLIVCSNDPAFHRRPAHCATRMLLLLSDKLMSCCAAGTNGCPDLRRSAFALGGRVSAEWSRCPDSMARRARDSVATLRRSSAGWMPARMGRLSAGVGRKHPVTICKALLMAGSMRWHQTGAQYSAVECTRARVAIRRVVAPALQPASLLLGWKAAGIFFVMLSFSFQVWRYSPTVAMSLVSTPPTAYQSPSAWHDC